MIDTILVCYEERPVAHRVLTRAAELARAFSAKVIVTSVAPMLHTRGVGPFDPADSPARHREEVDDAVARLSELGVTGVDAVVAAGDPRTEILKLAGERKVDLIVLGAHEGGLLSRLIEGSIGDAVAHKAQTDVLIVH